MWKEFKVINFEKGSFGFFQRLWSDDDRLFGFLVFVCTSSSHSCIEHRSDATCELSLYCTVLILTGDKKNLLRDCWPHRERLEAKRKRVKKVICSIHIHVLCSATDVNCIAECKLLATRRRNCRATEQRLQSFFRLRVNHKCKRNRAWIK